MRTTAQHATAPRLSVIVPAFRCAAVLRACLAGLLASNLPRDQWELVVVDDGSPDDTADVARSVADIVLVTPDGPKGPAAARNLGALAAKAPLLLFVDSDVVVAPETLAGFLQLLETHPDISAAFGAYDRAPADPGFISQYRNLLHRYVHTLNPGNATTFWAGCGAVRRDAFLSVGGFDAVRYPRPQIEDIDLGYRLSARGLRIVLAPELTGKHLKRWTFGNMVRTDLRERAIPWMHLLIERRAVGGSGALNLAAMEKVYTVLTGVAAVAVLLYLWTREGRWLSLLLTSLTVVIAGNAKLLAWFARERGVVFALGVVPLRVLFYLIGGLGAAWALATHGAQPARTPLPALDASAERVVAQ